MRLVIFDVDGTLVDSQTEIVTAMTHAYRAEGLPAPDPKAVLSIVGLSLPEALLRLAPDLNDVTRAHIVQGYKSAYMDRRQTFGAAAGSPLYPGAQAVLDQLQAQPETLLAVATGKSRRGLDKLIEAHGWSGIFVSQQVSDFHPSKPHPAMILAALAETGVDPANAVMIGDTTFDMEMARSAGVRSIGVAWGYHATADLNADRIVQDFAALPAAIDDLIGA